MARALVTGATGLVGSYLCARLRERGWHVRALVRNADAARWLTGDGVELARGDVLDATSLAAALSGCTAVVHAAALVTPRAGWETFHRTNVEGTRTVVSAAEAAGVRMLHVSSVAVYGPRARYADEPTHEDVPLAPLDERHWYARSKRDSEAVVLEAHARGTLWATVIRPAVVYGRRDRQFVPRVARLIRGGIVPLPGGGSSTLAIVHAGNVADAGVLALESEHAGGRAYNVANEGDVRVAAFFRLAAEGLGRRVRLVHTPLALARAGVLAARAVLRAAGARALGVMLESSIEFVTRDNPFTSKRAVCELGWTPRVSPHLGIPDAFRWYARHA